MGADIAGACGQLVISEEKKERAIYLGDIEDGPFHQGTNNSESSLKEKTVKNWKQINATKNVDDERNDEFGKNVEKWVKPLAVATTVSFCVCLLSAGVVFFQKRKR
jgi:hypothetical protein